MFVKNLIIIIFIVIIPLNSISLFFYYSNSKYTRNEVYNSNRNLAYNVRNISDTLVKQIETLTINTTMQEDVLNYLMYPSKNNEAHPKQSSINRYIKNFTFTYDYLDSIYIYSEKNNTVISDSIAFDFNDFTDRNWFDAYKQVKTERAEFVLRSKSDNYPYFLSLIAPVYMASTEKIGGVIVNIDIQELTKAFKEIDSPTAQEIFIISHDQRIIYSSIPDAITKPVSDILAISDLFEEERQYGELKFVNKGDNIYSSVESKYYDWTYYSVIPLSFYKDRFVNMIKMLLLLILASIIVSVFIAFYISLRTFQPISNIIDLIDYPEKWMGRLYTDKPENEVSYILKKINNTLMINKELEKERDARLMILKHAQTVALQSQINPHFLYNTLDAINWMAINLTGGENNVSEAITILGDLYKSNIDTVDYLTKLEYEIQYTKQYIKILKLRYKNIFEVHWDVCDHLLNAKIPRLTLQPLIENALYHSIKPKNEKGNIFVSVKSQNDDYVITITDDGVGFDQKQLAKLNLELSKDYAFLGKHIGIKNINQRIKLIYGNEYGVQIESGKWGTKVKLIFPYIE